MFLPLFHPAAWGPRGGLFILGVPSNNAIIRHSRLEILWPLIARFLKVRKVVEDGENVGIVELVIRKQRVC
jgi:hypothetical protein